MNYHYILTQLHMDTKLMKRKKEKNNINWICEFVIGFFVIAPFAMPGYVLDQYDVHGISKVQVFCGIVCFFAYFFSNPNVETRKLLECKWLILVGGLFSCYYLILTVCLHGNTMELISQVVVCISECMVIFIALTRKNDGMLSGMLLYFEIMILLTLLFQIVYPEGLYNFESQRSFGFFGHVNSELRQLYPGLFFSIILSYRRHNRISVRALGLLAIFSLLVLLTKSATSIVAIGVVDVMLIIFFLKDDSKIIRCRNVFAGSGLLFVGIVLLNQISLFQWFIVDVLNRDLTFTGRTILWGKVMVAISQKPFFGYGYQGEAFIRHIVSIGGYSNVSCHDLYLDITMRSGIVGMAMIVLFVLIVCKRIDDNISCEINRITVILLIGIFVSIVFEPFIDSEFRFFIVPLVMAYIVASPCCSMLSRTKAILKYRDRRTIRHS